MDDNTLVQGSHRSGQLVLAGLALGFSFGGFFDGILLHQILQWHHLLSGLEDARQDIRTLILADGLFHLLMYVIAGAGLWLLWRSRRGHGGRHLLSNVSFGFGLWHIVDGVLSHWVLGLHRIRMDVENPLFWDVLWLSVFGFLPLAVGWWLRRINGIDIQRSTTVRSLAFLIIAAGLVTAFPPSSSSTAIVLFRPGISEADALAAIHSIDGRLVWADASKQLWMIDASSGGSVSRLYLHGAAWVSSAILPAGCLAWTKA